MANLRKKWATAEAEMDEAIGVCRSIEEAINSEQFCQLKTVPVLETNPPEKAWARQLRLELRRKYGKQKLLDAAPTSNSRAANDTIFTKQAQPGTALKRKLSVGTISEEHYNGTPPTKRSKACQAGSLTNGYLKLKPDEYDEAGLHFTYISPLSSSSCSSESVICLDDDEDDECDEVIMMPSPKNANAQPSLNISSSSLATSSSAPPTQKVSPSPLSNGLFC
ncbi:hypothetical protein GCK32_012443, partial [Trichostrongylus colubriformis]